MIKRVKAIALVLGIAALTAVLYKPVVILAFHIKEPKFLCPIAYYDEVKLRSDGYGEGMFGAKRSGGRLHLGIDLQAPVGTPVRAAKSGRAFASKNAGMGKYVVIKHIDGSKTIYGHLSKMFVVNSEPVRRGDIIGEVGKTGNAWNPCMLPHVHFEIKIGEDPVDPLAGYMQLGK
jgi:murein DD-endopeptidase MepM/ murein hydrolase activator NlpD